MHACTVKVLLYKCPCSWCCTALAQGLRGRRAPRGDFSPVSDQVRHRGKISPRAAGDAKTLHHPVLLVLPERPMGIPRAPESPCRVLQSIDWEGEQALFELTLVDALHCDRLRTDQAG